MIYATSNRPGNDYSRIIELEAVGNIDGSISTDKNWALASQGGVASASSVDFPYYTPVEAVNDGLRTGAHWTTGSVDSGWRAEPENHFPEWVQVTFDQPHVINRIEVINPQSDAGSTVKEPIPSMTFSRNGDTDFEVQYFDATAQSWQTVPNGVVHDNDKVWREFTFPAVMTQKVRVVVNGALPGQWGDVRAGLVELEAWGPEDDTPQPPTPPTNTTGIYQVYADHINTPRSLVDVSTDKTVWTWEGEAFGNTVPNEDPNQSGTTTAYNLRFPGQYFDQESKLFYNYFRDYSPSTGRYVQSDPIGLNGGVNTYSYAGGRPFDQLDALGLQGRGPYQPSSHTALEQAILRGDVEKIKTLMEAGEAYESTFLRECVSKRGSQLVNSLKDAGTGQGARSGQHGTPFKQAGSELIREGNKIGGQLREVYSKVGNRLIEQGKAINH